MSYLHRNSQKRIYVAGVRYFITSVTYDRYPYFKNPILAELFVRDLWFAKELKGFDLFGYTVMPDHVHLLFQPKGKANYSEIMRSLKTNFSRNANDIILNRVGRFQSECAGDVTSHRLRNQTAKNNTAPRPLQDQNNSPDVPPHHPHDEPEVTPPSGPRTGDRFKPNPEEFRRHHAIVVVPLLERFLEQHPRDRQMPAFKWQKSFRDHYIRSQKDFLSHLEYIYHNAVKHGIVSNPAQYRFVWIRGMPGPFAPD